MVVVLLALPEIIGTQLEMAVVTVLCLHCSVTLLLFPVLGLFWEMMLIIAHSSLIINPKGMTRSYLPLLLGISENCWDNSTSSKWNPWIPKFRQGDKVEQCKLRGLEMFFEKRNSVLQCIKRGAPNRCTTLLCRNAVDCWIETWEWSSLVINHILYSVSIFIW